MSKASKLVKPLLACVGLLLIWSVIDEEMERADRKEQTQIIMNQQWEIHQVPFNANGGSYLKIYRNTISGNCYILDSRRASQLQCEDFLEVQETKRTR